jgi:hypothetical protein
MEQSLVNQPAAISTGGWGFAAWVISYAGISRDALMLPLRLLRIAAGQSVQLSSTFSLNRTAAD